jgi:hypothetical protein
MTRAEGYYWVSIKGLALVEIAEWMPAGRWYFIGDDEGYPDEAVDVLAGPIPRWEKV